MPVHDNKSIVMVALNHSIKDDNCGGNDDDDDVEEEEDEAMAFYNYNEPLGVPCCCFLSFAATRLLMIGCLLHSC